MPQPTLATDRLILRPFSRADAPAVQHLAGAYEIADTTLNIPHPYLDGAAAQWIATHRPNFDTGASATFAIVRRHDATLCGAIGLVINQQFARAEMGYWLGVPFWNQGVMTEAAHALLHYGFTQRNLHRVYAFHLTRNPASGRVMQKIGMRHEGTLREHVRKWERWEDLEVYGLLHNEWQPA